MQGDKSAGKLIYTAEGCPEGVRYREVAHETGDLADLIIAKFIVFPRWDRLQSEDFTPLLKG